MSQTLAEGVVIVRADANDVPRDIRSQIESNQAPIEEAGRRSGSSLFGGFAKMAVGATAVIGATVGGLAIAGGFSRALSIQDATKKLEGLGHDTSAVASIMESALNSVRGTAFGLGAAATTSAGLVAAGVGLGDELTRRLKTVADTATIAGRGMEDVGTIFGSVAAKGKLQGDDLLQLMSSGVPVLQFLSQHLGVTSAEISEMVSEGKIDFATFADAMEAGIGGAALRGGETARGAFANIMAALGRLGAAFVTPLVAGAPALFSSISGMIDGVTKSAGPLSEAFAARVTPAIQALSEWLGKLDFAQIINSVASFSPLLAVLGMLQPIFPALMDALAPVVPALGELATAVGPLLQSAILQVLPLVVALVTVFVNLLSAAGPVISFVAENIEVFASLAVAIGAGVVAFRLWTGAIAAFRTAAAIATGLQIAFNLALAANPIGLIVTAITAVVAALTYFFTQTELGQAIWAEFTRFLGEAWNNIVAVATTVWTALADFFTTIWTNVSTGVTNVWNGIAAFLGPIFEVIGNIIRVYVETWVNIIIVMAAILVTIWQGIVNVVMTVWNAIVGFLTPIVAFIVNMVVSYFTALWNYWSGVWNTVWGFLVGVWNNIIGFLTPIVLSVVAAVQGPIGAIVGWWNGVWGGISSFFSGIWSNMVGAVSNAVGQIGSWVGGIADTVRNAIGNAASWLVNAGSDVVRGFWNGITSMGDWLFRQVTGFFDNVTGWAKGVLGIQSPSRVFRLEVGQMVGEGMALGVADSAVTVRHAIDSLVTVPGLAAQRMGASFAADAAPGASAPVSSSSRTARDVHVDLRVTSPDPTLAGRQFARSMTERLGV